MNDSRNPTTIEQLLQKYNLSDIGKTKKAVELNQNTITQVNNELNSFVSTTTETLNNLQSQVDGNITTWFFSGVPTLLNSPASDWTTTDDKIKHLGDLYYDQLTGDAYRFMVEDNTYFWFLLPDSDLAAVLALANAAQDTADNKRRVFVATPTTPYDNGDLWINNNEIFICQVSKTESETFDEDDFINNLKYTDDTLATEVDGKVTVLSGQVTTIEQNVDSITQTVTTTTTVQNNMLSDMNVLRESISTVQETVLTQTENSFQVWLEETGLQNTLNELGDLVDGNSTQLETISTYFRFTIDGLEIGKSGDQVKLLIANNKISFMTGSTESAYITENKLYITDSTIITRLQLGQFVTEIDSLGNANKRWVSV